MQKAVKRKISKVETMAIADAENAKWLGIGFIASIVLVGILCFMILQLKAR